MEIGKILNNVNSNGYKSVGLSRKRIKISMYVHILVAQAFVNNPDPVNKIKENE